MFKKNHSKQILRASKRAKGAMGMFQRAHDELDSANEVLGKVADDAQAKAEQLLRHAEEAKQGIVANVNVQKNLKSFIEGGV
ncbi:MULTISPECIES: hypothetical protein [Paenibacillus]|uniref:hypothetical protein n=1 Tax=Paenibacillus TaxID=44249 RepID=UPI000F53A4B2|nr:hypothetical protein [Paenibacillus xylanexedens]RPK20016.1 hypothetical protein EDO6_06533 [Paenibacillus xylanexedens]